MKCTSLKAAELTSLAATAHCSVLELRFSPRLVTTALVTADDSAAALTPRRRRARPKPLCAVLGLLADLQLIG